jgi:hypothetical protein
VVVVAFAGALSGCIARHVVISEKGLTCIDAQRVAIDAVRGMGYTIDDSTKATPGTRGVVSASRHDGTSTRRVFVTITCTTMGAEVEAKPDGGGIAQLDFANQFRRSYEKAIASKPPPRPAAAAGVDILLTPERATGSEELPVDVSAAGVLPVSVRITNHTARAYRLKVADVVLQTAAGERVKPLDAASITAKLPADAAAAAQKKALRSGDIRPDETLTGFLFFPFNSYVRARVQLRDVQSDETEGFAIEL